MMLESSCRSLFGDVEKSAWLPDYETFDVTQIRPLVSFV